MLIGIPYQVSTCILSDFARVKESIVAPLLAAVDTLRSVEV
jgi:hypothetical protein